MPVVFNETQFATGTASSVAAATEIELAVADSQHTVEVLRVKLRHTSGAAATFTPRIHSATGGAAGAISQEFAASSTAVADLCDVEAAGVICQTDTSGKLYLLPVPNTGSDNMFAYTVVWRVLP